jgi:hypothetical protein
MNRLLDHRDRLEKPLRMASVQLGELPIVFLLFICSGRATTVLMRMDDSPASTKCCQMIGVRFIGSPPRRGRRSPAAHLSVGQLALVGPTLARGDAQLNPVVVVSPVSSPTGADGRAPPNMTLLGVGLATFGLGYGLSWSMGMSSDHWSDEKLLLPVVGPWLDLASRFCHDETIATADGPIEPARRAPCGTSAVERAVLVAGGVLQGLGALQIMGAFFAPLKPPSGLKAPPMPRFAIVPTFGAHGVGAMARGRF